MGFTPTASAHIPLSKLRSLKEFPTYLEQLNQGLSHSEASSVLNKTATKLSDWLEGIVETGWQTIETLVAVNPAQALVVRDMEQPEIKVKWAKVIDLGVQLGNDQVVLALVLTTQPNKTINILVQVYPKSGTPYLPTNLKLEMLSDSGKILQETLASGFNNYAQLRRFSGQQNDRFSIAITLDGVTVKEDFVL
mgnify:FL=1